MNTLTGILIIWNWLPSEWDCSIEAELVPIHGGLSALPPISIINHAVISFYRAASITHENHRILVFPAPICQWFWYDAVFCYSHSYVYRPFHMYFFMQPENTWQQASRRWGISEALNFLLTNRRGEVRVDTVIISFAHAASIMQPYSSSNDLVTRVHNNNIAHAMPTRKRDVTLLGMA